MAGTNGDNTPRGATVQEMSARLKLLMSMVQAKCPRTTLEINTKDIVMLVGQLQIALTHNLNTGPAAVAAKKMCDWLITYMDDIQAGIGETLALGYRPDFKWGLVPPPVKPAAPSSPIISTEGPHRDDP